MATTGQRRQWGSNDDNHGNDGAATTDTATTTTLATPTVLDYGYGKQTWRQVSKNTSASSPADTSSSSDTSSPLDTSSSTARSQIHHQRWTKITNGESTPLISSSRVLPQLRTESHSKASPSMSASPVSPWLTTPVSQGAAGYPTVPSTSSSAFVPKPPALLLPRRRSSVPSTASRR